MKGKYKIYKMSKKMHGMECNKCGHMHEVKDKALTLINSKVKFTDL